MKTSQTFALIAIITLLGYLSPFANISSEWITVAGTVDFSATSNLTALILQALFLTFSTLYWNKIHKGSMKKVVVWAELGSFCFFSFMLRSTMMGFITASSLTLFTLIFALTADKGNEYFSKRFNQAN